MENIKSSMADNRPQASSAKALLVTGMHRSATSSLMRVCNLLGVRLVGDQMPPDQDNPQGYWEPTEVVNAHELLLADLGRSWHDRRPLPPGWLETNAAERWRARILDVIAADCKGVAVWGLKDPRLCRLLPLWIQIVERLDSKPYVLHLFRHPDQVAASLRNRDSYPVDTPYELWLRYVMDMERDSRPYPRAFISYEALLADWRGVLTAAAEQMGFLWPYKMDEVAGEVDAFLNLGRRRQRGKAIEEVEQTEAAKDARELYKALSVAAAGDERTLTAQVEKQYAKEIKLPDQNIPLDFNDPNTVRAIAFYLPQFHPNPENDRWWGKGFTEWINVARALPRFAGHYQPHLPADLGFYDLRMPEIRAAQAELARKYGIYGFCYYYYWFNGQRLFDKPINEVLNSGEPDFPFCLCWANENLTRMRPDGGDDILITQQHSPEDDIAFIHSVIPAFRDRRYIRVNDRPLLVVYKPELFPNFVATVGRWREACEAADVGNPYVCIVQGGNMDSSLGGFNAAVEFPPHNYWNSKELNPPFAGMLSSYKEAYQKYMQRPDPSYTLFRGAMPSWDNSSQRREQVFQAFLGTDPAYYREWLKGAVQWTRGHRSQGERFVFINAWNDWGDGCHLEPDIRYGHSWLEATRAALQSL